MDSEQKRIINSLILELRALMEEELELVLKHYGIFLKRNWIDIEQLDFLSDEEKEAKKKLEIFIKRKEKIGINKEESTKEFITEATYHWLNRIFGLKCLESRDLIEEIITTRSDYSGRSYIHRNYLEEHPKLKKSEDEGYFQCLFEFLSKLTTEIQIIFDPKDIHMLIKPRITLLKKIIKKINNLDREIYQNDEFLGWIYQYFHDKERDNIYKRIKKEKLKIGGSNLIPITQLYTEDYMVKFLSQNSLGSIWMEMYPKSQLFKNWEYYVESPNNEIREVKDVSEIKILDPACGSGHFLIYLFDMLYDMYLEEGKIAVKDIVNEIIEKNLFGIDIDTRAIQITGLVLYLKFKEKSLEETSDIPRFNLFTADIVSFKTEILNEFLNEFDNNKVLKKIIVTIWSNLEDIREVGSLSQIDQAINKLINEEMEQNREGILRFTENKIENWHLFQSKILNKLKKFIQTAIQTYDINKELFAKDEEKGIWLIEAFENKYDIVITNPPYLGSNKLTLKLKKIFKKDYPHCYRDLYAMFIRRNYELINDNGYIAMITMQSFMFITSYKHFRSFLLNRVLIQKLIHLGPFSFLEMGDHVKSVMFIMKKTTKIEIPGSYYKLDHFQERNDKIENLINTKFLFEVNQNEFRVIDETPFIYWISDKIRSLFRDNIKFNDYCPAREGLSTRNNERFLRFWWEVSKSSLSSYNTEEKRKFFFYAKGGLFNKWYGNLHLVVNWECRNHGAVTRNQDFYFKKGITFTKISSAEFNARILPSNCIFNSVGPSCFIEKESDLYYILGFLNSCLGRFLLSNLNPTVATTVGNINQLPFIQPEHQNFIEINEFVKELISIKKKILSYHIIEWEFEKTGLEYGIEKEMDSIKLIEFYKRFIRYKESLILKSLLIEAKLEKIIFQIYSLNEVEIESIIKKQGKIPGFLSLIKNFDELPDFISSKFTDYYIAFEKKEITPKNLDMLGKKTKEFYEKYDTTSVYDILSSLSIQLKINPISIYNIIDKLDLINKNDYSLEVENFISKIIIELLEEEKSGIISLNEPSDKEILYKRVLTKFDRYFGEDNTDNIVKQINNLFGKSIDEWIEKDFFKNHISHFKKRPIIWHLSSEKKSFQCFIDYHKLSQNLLMVLKNKYLEKRLKFLREESKILTESLKNELNDSKIKELNRSYMEIEDMVEDLQKFSENLEKVIKLNIEFDEDKGVKEQILPFQKNNLLSINKVV